MALATGPNAIGPNTILQRVNRLSDKYDEALAGGTVTPGDLIRFQSDGSVIRHDSAGKYAMVVVAIEDEFIGRTIDDNYAQGELVRFFRCSINDTFLSKVVSGAFIQYGDFLTSNGDGTFKIAGAGDTALTAAEQTASNVGAAQRIEMRTLPVAPAGQTGSTSTTSTTTTSTTTTTLP